MTSLIATISHALHLQPAGMLDYSGAKPASRFWKFSTQKLNSYFENAGGEFRGM